MVEPQHESQKYLDMLNDVEIPTILFMQAGSCLCQLALQMRE